jgi:density-regulated protein
LASAGVPSEYNDYLPKDSEEYRKWKAFKESQALSGDMEGLKVAEKADKSIEEDTKASKKKKKKPEKTIVLERNTRNKKKCITTVSGLDSFGIKLSEASKLFGKKFASGASVVKTADAREEIDIQGDHLDGAIEFILKQYKDVAKNDIWMIENKKKLKYFDDDDD